MAATDLVARNVVRAYQHLIDAADGDSSIELQAALASLDTWLRRQPDTTKKRLVYHFGFPQPGNSRLPDSIRPKDTP